MAKLTVKIRGDATHVEKTFARVTNSGLALGKNLAGLALKTAAWGTALAGVGSAAAGVHQLAGFIKDASGKAASFESLATNFEVLTGSAKGAKDMLAQMREEAQKSPLSLNDYANAGKTLMAFGTAAGDVMPILHQLGDVSMGDAERFGNLSLAFAQISATGRLMGQDLLQLVNAGFNPLQVISKRTGESMVSLKKKVEDGEISLDVVKQAFTEATSKGGLFYQAIQRGAETTEGKLAKLGDASDSLKISFGQGFNEGLKKALDSTSSFLGQFEAKLRTLGVIMGVAISDAVDGNFGIVVASGKVLGEALLVGLKSATMIGGKSLIDGLLSGEKSDMGVGGSSAIRGMIGPSPAASDIVSANITNSEGLANAIRDLKNEVTAAQSRNIDAKIQNPEVIGKIIARSIRESAPPTPTFSR